MADAEVSRLSARDISRWRLRHALRCLDDDQLESWRRRTAFFEALDHAEFYEELLIIESEQRMRAERIPAALHGRHGLGTDASDAG